MNREGEPVYKAHVVVQRRGEKAGQWLGLSDEQGYVSFDWELKATDSISVTISHISYGPYTTLKRLGDIGEKTKFVLSPRAYDLKEFTVSEEVPKRYQKGDTTVYKVSAYRRHPKENLERLISRMEDFDVDANGVIKFKDKPIEGILVDGDMVSKEDYRELSQNLSEQHISKLEVLENYASNPILKDFENSDKVMLNLVTNKKVATEIKLDAKESAQSLRSYQAHIFSFSRALKVITNGGFSTTSKELITTTVPGEFSLPFYRTGNSKEYGLLTYSPYHPGIRLPDRNFAQNQYLGGKTSGNIALGKKDLYFSVLTKKSKYQISSNELLEYQIDSLISWGWDRSYRHEVQPQVHYFSLFHQHEIGKQCIVDLSLNLQSFNLASSVREQNRGLLSDTLNLFLEGKSPWYIDSRVQTYYRAGKGLFLFHLKYKQWDVQENMHFTANRLREPLLLPKDSESLFQGFNRFTRKVETGLKYTRRLFGHLASFGFTADYLQDRQEVALITDASPKYVSGNNGSISTQTQRIFFEYDLEERNFKWAVNANGGLFSSQGISQGLKSEHLWGGELSTTLTFSKTLRQSFSLSYKYSKEPPNRHLFYINGLIDNAINFKNSIAQFRLLESHKIKASFSKQSLKNQNHFFGSLQYQFNPVTLVPNRTLEPGLSSTTWAYSQSSVFQSSASFSGLISVMKVEASLNNQLIRENQLVNGSKNRYQLLMSGLNVKLDLPPLFTIDQLLNVSMTVSQVLEDQDRQATQLEPVVLYGIEHKVFTSLGMEKVKLQFTQNYQINSSRRFYYASLLTECQLSNSVRLSAGVYNIFNTKEILSQSIDQYTRYEHRLPLLGRFALIECNFTF